MARAWALHPIRLAAILVLCLAARPAQAEFWETPDALGAGRFPSFFATKAGPLLIWQDSQSSGESGKAWIRFSRFEGGAWKAGMVSETAYTYNSANAPPILYSATQARNGAIAVAIAASGTSIEVKLMREGSGKFEGTGILESSTTSVAPRIFPSSMGGWLIFATQGKPSSATTTAQTQETAAPAGISPSSISIYVAKSVDGAVWSPFESLVGDNENLLMNVAP